VRYRTADTREPRGNAIVKRLAHSVARKLSFKPAINRRHFSEFAVARFLGVPSSQCCVLEGDTEGKVVPGIKEPNARSTLPTWPISYRGIGGCNRWFTWLKTIEKMRFNWFLCSANVAGWVRWSWCRLHRNMTELGIIKLSAVNDSMNKRRDHQVIVCRYISFVICTRNYLSFHSTDNGLPTHTIRSSRSGFATPQMNVMLFACYIRCQGVVRVVYYCVGRTPMGNPIPREIQQLLWTLWWSEQFTVREVVEIL
jgi:hypothetical protein